MSNILLTIIMVLLIAVLVYVGYILHRIRKFMATLEEILEPAPKTGPTQGSYSEPTTKRKPTVRVVTPKTPARVAYEAEVKQLEEARRGKVELGPK
jgi:hypothetical protein